MDAEHKKEYWQRMLPNLVLLMMVLLSLFCLLVSDDNNHDDWRGDITL